MESFNDWFERFMTWVRYEPVRATEAVRTTLYGITGLLAVFGPGVGDVATQIMAVVTGLFSIYASQSTRNKVTPVAKFEDVFEAAKAEHGLVMPAAKPEDADFEDV